MDYQLEQKLFAPRLQLFGIWASIGGFDSHIKSINGRLSLRIGAAAFTAVTQMIWERDIQIEERRALVELTKNKELRIKTWEKASIYPCYVFGFIGIERFFSPAFKPFFEAWDKQHGLPELRHRIRTLYNSDAIFYKSLLVGASLGTLPFLQKVFYLYGNRCLNKLLYGKWVVHPSEPQVSYCGLADHPLNSLYARSIGEKPFLNPTNSAAIGVAHAAAAGYLNIYRFSAWFNTAKGCRTNMHWYSRKGKVPIWQYNVEEE